MSDDVLDPIDLTAFREGRIEVIGEIKKRDWNGCRHPKHRVDTELRRVTCRDCGEQLDPIECIITYVHFWDSMAHEFRRLNELRQEQRQREQQRKLNQMARKVAREGGVWACSVGGVLHHSEFWESPESWERSEAYRRKKAEAGVDRE